MKKSQFPVPLIPVAWGELIDKITILEIKLQKIKTPESRKFIRGELEALCLALESVEDCVEALPKLKDELSAVNSELWAVEDAIREKESSQLFDHTFISLARSVYRLNDKRASIKKKINDLLNSEFVEIKSYKAY